MAFLRVLCDYTAIALENARHVKLIHQLSITDDCTGLFNARHLYFMLEQEIAAANKSTRFSLVFFDLDHFKSINDRHGHLAGSRLLAEVGNLLKRTLGPDHAGFRYGGDEFVGLLRGLDKAAATQLVQRVHACIHEAHFLTAAGLDISLTASFGVATFPEDGATLPELIRAADAMMYTAKAEGRNRIAVADSSKTSAFPAPRTSRHS